MSRSHKVVLQVSPPGKESSVYQFEKKLVKKIIYYSIKLIYTTVLVKKIVRLKIRLGAFCLRFEKLSIKIVS